MSGKYVRRLILLLVFLIVSFNLMKSIKFHRFIDTPKVLNSNSPTLKSRPWYENRAHSQSATDQQAHLNKIMPLSVTDQQPSSAHLNNISSTTASSAHLNNNNIMSSTTSTDQQGSSAHLNNMSVSIPEYDVNITATTGTILLQDLQFCSRIMGISQQSLLRSRDTIVEVNRRAELFLQNISSLLPTSFSGRYKNPCWAAEIPHNLSPTWEKKLMTFFRSGGLGRIPKNMTAGSFSDFLSEPVNENSKDNILHCLPNFFLAGFPKSATTSVHGALQKHHQIMEPQLKEPHWWSRGLALSKSKKFETKFFRISFMAYTLFFKKVSSKLKSISLLQDSVADLITYDGSQSTLWDSNFFYNGQDYCAMPAVISRVLPNSKFIVVMRNPVSRLYSDFLYDCKMYFGNFSNWPSVIKEKGSHVFHTLVSKGVQAFNECRKNMSAFECTNILASNRSHIEFIEGEKLKCGLEWARVAIGLYVVHLRKWLQFYPMENFLFIRTEDISKDPFGTMSRITQFLDVAPVSRKMAEDMLGKNQNVLNKVHVQPMENRTEIMLKEFYEPFNKELADMLNTKHYLWTD